MVEDVGNALNSVGIDLSHVKVRARDGVVTLRGQLRSNEAVQLAGDTAASVSGVKTVKNRLRVRK
ncbi:BON domain-containing protein [Paraburkholderia sediminicola]